MHDLIIIGGGAAALSAASYGLSKQLKVLLLYETLGGKTGRHFTINSEEDYLVGHILVHMAFPNDKPMGEAQFAGEEAIHLFERQIQTRSGMALRDRVLSVEKKGDGFKVTTALHGVQETTAVIIATGVTPITLDVPGAREFLGQGLGYSATTYARLVDGKMAAVVGTTQRALRGAAELARSAARVYLIALETETMDTPLLETLRTRPNVEILQGYGVKEVRGRSTVEQLVLERHGVERLVNVDAAFVDLGLKPNSALVANQVKTDAEGFIVVDKHNATSVPGIFAAGDVTTAFGEQVLIAIGEGARAALGAYDYLLTQTISYEIGSPD
ncbi:MAG: NAD(P)/FAD-dependent oxidoreductase [Chloroflexaceae bacterium]|jgi:thioredoxin reductase|nr:NAD(P)/FAD-dependent oxidoreductase [Chloroflexaceae bacterium]